MQTFYIYDNTASRRAHFFFTDYNIIGLPKDPAKVTSGDIIADDVGIGKSLLRIRIFFTLEYGSVFFYPWIRIRFFYPWILIRMIFFTLGSGSAFFYPWIRIRIFLPLDTDPHFFTPEYRSAFFPLGSGSNFFKSDFELF